MDAQRLNHRRQLRRRQHVRSGIVGTSSKPRLSVFRSSKHIYAQLIDDINGVTLAAASSKSKDLQGALKYGGNIKAAALVGQKLAEIAKTKNISEAAFDRGHYRFHGRIQALAVAATKSGLKCCNPDNVRKPKPKVEAPPAKPEKPKKEGGKEGKPKGEKAEKPKAEAKA
jgi:large subunit ribosomal protein L18